MPTYVLEGSGRAVFPQRPVVLTLTVSGATTAATMRAMIGATEDPRAVRPTVGLMVLPRIDAPTVLRISPASGNEFPHGTTIYVSVAVEDRSDPDPDMAVIGPLDVSGEAQVDIASMQASGGNVVISAMRSGTDVELGPIAGQARIAARSIFGFDQVPEHLQFPITVLIDPSASMLPAIEDRSLAAVCDIIAGIASVVSPDQQPRMCFLGPTLRWVDYPSLAECGAAVQGALESSYLVAGFSSSLLSELSTPENSMIFVVSDAFPADDPDLSVSKGRHLIAIAAASTSGEVLGRDPNTTFVTPPTTGTATNQLAAQKDTVNNIVRSLLAGTSAAGRGSVSVAPR